MFGSWYFLFLIFTLGLGVFMIIKRGKPNYFTARLIGIYFLILAILILILSTFEIIAGSYNPFLYFQF